MDEIIKLLTDSFGALTSSPSWLVLLVFLNLIGAYLQWAHWCDNRLIPLLLGALGGFFYWLLGPAGTISPDQKHPEVVLAMIGVIVGAVAYGLQFTLVSWWKKKFPSGTVPLIFLIGSLAIAPVALTSGCTGGPGSAQKVAYVSLNDTWSGVKGAMRVYGQACVEKKVSEAKQVEIDAAYARFYMSFNAALRLAQFDWTAVTPPAQGQLAQEIITLIEQLKL